MFVTNIENLKKILPLYNTDYWSNYSLDGNISSGFYHRLVIKQLNVLCEFDEFFCKCYNQWLKYQNDKFYALRALANKIRRKL